MAEKIRLWKDASIASSLTLYLLPGAELRPAVLIIPGGGYSSVCIQSEGTPVARTFNALGFHAFVLDYRVAPNRFPAPQQDAFRAMKLIRANASKWNVIPDRIAAAGFSAGGHLAGCLGTMENIIDADDRDDADRERGSADALLLCYGVLALLNGQSHLGTFHNLAGRDSTMEEKAKYSLSERVSETTPPAFLFHTIGDKTVDYHNSLAFAEAMVQAGRPCELHLYPYGAHGMLLGLGTGDVGNWPKLAKDFLLTQWELRDGDRGTLMQRYTNAFQYAEEKKAGLCQ